MNHNYIVSFKLFKKGTVKYEACCSFSANRKLFTAYDFIDVIKTNSITKKQLKLNVVITSVCYLGETQ